MRSVVLHLTSLTLMIIVVTSLMPPSLNSKGISDYSSTQHYRFQSSLAFNGTRAFTFLEEQCAFGPRPPGSDNLTQCREYLISVLEGYGWTVRIQNWSFQETLLRNIVAGAILAPRLVLLAHYDTRPIADNDPDPTNRSKPILGANDGASGVATLLELAAILPETARNSVALLFVDAEDSGNINEWPWIIGSTHYVNNLTTIQKDGIDAVILLDMVGDADLQIKREQSSTPRLVNVLWAIASHLGYSHIFQNVSGYTLIDDHRSFLDAGIPAVDIIDFDYPYWHTLADTPDKCSPDSLETVGRVVEQFVIEQLGTPTNFRPQTPTPPLIQLIGVLVGITGISVLTFFFYLRLKRRRE